MSSPVPRADGRPGVAPRRSEDEGADHLLAQRYAVRPARRLGPRARTGLITAGLLAAVLVVLWIALGQAGRPTSRDVGFELESSARITVDFEVTRDPGQPVRCGIEALNDTWAVVGYTEVQLEAREPDAPRTTAHRVPVRTTNLATTGRVDDCWSEG